MSHGGSSYSQCMEEFTAVCKLGAYPGIFYVPLCISMYLVIFFSKSLALAGMWALDMGPGVNKVEHK
jgi:hypothetical protein